MDAVSVIETVLLIPVLELAPWDFSTEERAMPLGSSTQSPESWLRFWQDSLADSGVRGLEPVCPGSWHVPTKALIDAGMLERILHRVIDSRGGMASLSDPDSASALNGGLALANAGEVLFTPTCCSDLGNIADWQQATLHRGPGWQTLWIGHPWVSVRYEPPWLLMSEPHESHEPVERWALSPDGLDRAVSAAVEELERFARQIASVLSVMGYQDDPALPARKLCGLADLSDPSPVRP
jgi:hypothetical protein